MKISYNWLKGYVDINETPEKLAELLTMHSFEVENIIYQGKGLDGVVVGEVIEKEKHSDADKLSIVKINIGDFRDSVSTLETKSLKPVILNIVCGAPNIEVGQKVAVALLGTELPSGLKIKKRKVRGVESCGMVCSEDELEIGTNHDGIMVLDKDLIIGTPIQEALSLDDVIFEIDILPNRAHDCLNHLGVAREVAVLLNKKLKINCHSERPQEAKNPVIMNEEFKKGIDASSCGTPCNDRELKVKIENKELCRRYTATFINDIVINKSPIWLKRKLESCDVRSINNIVDITNYVMLSLGQPMHAFNADKLNGKIFVRNARRGEKIIALDNNIYELNEDDLVIADETKPIAIAGVMGGAETAVNENTKNIIFESANFNGATIRKTSQRLKLASESSYRFEREIDPELTVNAISEAVCMVESLAGGQMEEKIFDIYPNRINAREINFGFNRIENLLGIKIEKEKVIEILNSLEFKVVDQGNNLNIKIPTFRIDIEKVNDIIEEIGRIYGYENIMETPSLVEMKAVEQEKSLIFEEDARKVFEGLGYCETYNYSFVGEKDIENIEFENIEHLELRNPISKDYQFMRNSLLPGLLKNVSLNLKYKDKFRLFEIGKVYIKIEDKLPQEKKIISGVVFDVNKKESLFYQVKNEIEVFLTGFGINTTYRKMKEAESFWHKGRSSEIFFKDKLIGKIGEVHPTVSNAFEIESRVLYFELYEESLIDFSEKRRTYEQINKYPRVELDLSVIFDENISWEEIKNNVLSVDSALIKNIEPFDIYRGKNLGENKKSIAFRISYQAEDRTLKDEEVEVVQGKIIKAMEKLGGKVRK
ncbi:MAG: phenylalanine--tRNA ligase subunit beta [Patescibacteria group bacterium]|nr:phenylalanine--tRNA ligase subunit beta [Patescibacteria group bacterium]